MKITKQDKNSLGNRIWGRLPSGEVPRKEDVALAFSEALLDHGVQIVDTYDEPEGIDYNALATAVEQMREAVKALTAGLEADGFTPREARSLVAGMFALHNREGD